MSSAIWWIRRDLRLTDNQALTAACKEATQVIPLFILDPAILTSRWASAQRTAFLFAGLRTLDCALRERGSRLFIRQGRPAEVLAHLIAESGASQIHAERDHTPYARRRDEAIAVVLPLTLYEGVTVRPLAAVLKKDDTPYLVYTPYRQRWLTHDPVAQRDILPIPTPLATPPTLASLPIPTEPALAARIPFPPGEAEAKWRLDQFTKGISASIYDYAQGRDQPARNVTAQLSPYLRFGMISARQAALAAYTAIEQAPTEADREGANLWLSAPGGNDA